MKRVFSTFALSGWAGYHGVSAAMLAAAAAEGHAAAGSLGVVIGGAPGHSGLLIGHALLAAIAFALVIAVRCARDQDRAEASVLVMLLLGAGLAATAGVVSAEASAPGLYALFMLVTLIAFLFDRMVTLDDEEADEADHARFMREAAELGLRFSPNRRRDQEDGR